jgi:hypothetical protein
MKRQATTTLILCGTLLSMALGCSKSEDSSGVAAETASCSTNLTGSEEAQPVQSIETQSLALTGTFGTDSLGNLVNCETRGLVDSSGKYITKKDSNNVEYAYGGECTDSASRTREEQLADAQTLRNQTLEDQAREDRLARETAANQFAQENAMPSFDAGAAARAMKPCGSGSGKTLEAKLEPEEKGRQPGVAAPGTSGLPGTVQSGPPSTADLNTLIATAKAGQSTGPITSQNPTQPAQQPAAGGTGGGLSSGSGSQIQGTGPGFEGNGNTSFSLTAPK